MSEIKDEMLERFLKYVTFDTESCDDATTVPTTEPFATPDEPTTEPTTEPDKCRVLAWLIKTINIIIDWFKEVLIALGWYCEIMI